MCNNLSLVKMKDETIMYKKYFIRNERVLLLYFLKKLKKFKGLIIMTLSIIGKLILYYISIIYE